MACTISDTRRTPTHSAYRIQVRPFEELPEQREDEREDVEDDIVLRILRERGDAGVLELPAPEPHDALALSQAIGADAAP